MKLMEEVYRFIKNNYQPNEPIFLSKLHILILMKSLYVLKYRVRLENLNFSIQEFTIFKGRTYYIDSDYQLMKIL